jgi:hypothetical protein
MGNLQCTDTTAPIPDLPGRATEAHTTTAIAKGAGFGG